MFGFFEKKREREEIAIFFAIESGKILSGIISFKRNSLPHLLYTHKEAITFQADLNEERLKELMLNHLEKGCQKIIKEGFLKITEKKERIHSYVFLGSPWYISISKEISVSKDKSFLIREGMLENIVRENFNIESNNVKIIDQKIVSVKGNGYILENPVGKKVETIDIKSFTNTVNKKIVDKIEEIIHRALPEISIEYHTTTACIFPVAKDLIDRKDFLIFIPEHEISDIVLVRNGKIESSVSMPFGKHTPIRTISAAFKNEKEGAYSLLNLHLTKKLEEEKSAEINEFLKLSKNKFQEVLRDTLWKLSKTVFLPHHIIVADGHPISKLMGEWIQTEEFSEKTLSVKSFNVFFLQNIDIEKNILIEKDIIYINPLILSIAVYLRSF